MTYYRLNCMSADQCNHITYPEDKLGDAIDKMMDNILCSWWEVIELWKYEYIVEGSDTQVIVKRTKIFTFFDED